MKPRTRNDPRGRRGNGPPFVMLWHWLLRSPAYLDLSPNAKAAYNFFRLRFNGYNNGRIAMSARDMGQFLKRDKSTGSRTIAELEAHGFIVCMRESAFNMKQKLAAEYRLTEEFCNVTNQRATKDFLHWKPTSAKTEHGCAGATQGATHASVGN